MIPCTVFETALDFQPAGHIMPNSSMMHVNVYSLRIIEQSGKLDPGQQPDHYDYLSLIRDNSPLATHSRDDFMMGKSITRQVDFVKM